MTSREIVTKACWKEYLKRKKRLSTGYKRKVMYRIRQRAKQEMEDLTLIIEGIKMISDHPEKDFAAIFEDEERRFRLLETLNEAYEKSFETDRMFFGSANLPIIITSLSRAGMGYYTPRQLSDKHARQKILSQLRKAKSPDGRTYYDEIVEEMMLRKLDATSIRVTIEKSKRLIASYYESEREDAALKEHEEHEKKSEKANSESAVD